MKTQILILASFLIICGCSNNKKSTQNAEFITAEPEVNTALVNEKEELTDPVEKQEVIEAEVAEIEEIDFSSIEYDPLDLPIVDNETGIKILTVGQFHEDEVSPEVKDQYWFGLYKEGTRSYVKKVKIGVTRVNDPILDYEGEKTGWDISVENKNECVLLIAGIDLKEADVPSFEVRNKEPIPGDTLTFDDNSMTIKLYVTGLKQMVSSDWYQLANYKMMLSISENDEVTTQNIIAIADFDDDMIDIIWIGDLDGDNKPDLIIDTSRHYNVMAPTLFLSSRAEKGEIVKCVALHETVGC